MKKLFFFLAISLLISSCSNKPDKMDAYFAAQSYIKPYLETFRLYNPDYPLTDFEFDDLNNNTYLIVVNVECENEFGEKRIMRIKAKMKHNIEKSPEDLENWEMIDFEVL